MSLYVATYNKLNQICAPLKPRRILRDVNTGDMVLGDANDTLFANGIEIGQISKSWDDSPGMLAGAKKDVAQWSWRVRLSFQEQIDTEEVFAAFEDVTFYPADTTLGSGVYRMSIVESVISDPPNSGAETGTQLDITLDIIPLRK